MENAGMQAATEQKTLEKPRNESLVTFDTNQICKSKFSN